MKIVVRGEMLPPGQAHAVAAEVRNVFREFAHRVAAVLVAVSARAEKRHCVIEVHMADGHVEYVEERQRRLGAALRRAVQRAWRAAARWLRQQLPVRGRAST